MAQEIVTWCDRHLNRDVEGAGERVPAEARHVALVVDAGRPVEYDADLCADCWAELFGPALAWLEENGRRPTAAKATSARSTTARANPSGNRVGPFACPLCAEAGRDYSVRRRGNLRDHMMRKHGTTLAELETRLGQTVDGKPLPHVCPECDAAYQIPQALGAHRRYAHGVPGEGRNLASVGP